MDESLQTTDLLEAILLELPPRDIFVSQRVSTTFRDTIKSSTRLQRALFRTQLVTSSYDQPAPQQVVQNSAITDMMKQNTVVHFNVKETYVSVSNLGVRNVSKTLRKTKKETKTELCVSLSVSRIAYYVKGGEKVCKPGSWEDMFLTQQVCKVFVSLELVIGEQGAWAGKGLDWQGTLGDLMEQAERELVA